jgi:hypothetical protein
METCAKMRSLGVISFLWACHNDVRDSEPATGTDDSSAVDDSTPVDDSSSFADDSDTTDDLGCDKLEIRYDGATPPHVGTQWILQLWCDDALLTLTIIRFIPSDFARLDENVATFLQAGDGTIQMQYGTERVYMDVTVLP